MYRVARKKLKGPSKALVVRAAGCNALIPAKQIDDVIFWAQGAGRSKPQGCIGVVTYREDPLQLFSLTEYLSTPKWHLSSLPAHWIVVVRVNGQRLGLAVEGLVGWGAIARPEGSSSNAANDDAGGFMVRLDEDAAVNAELVEVSSIFQTSTPGRYFYV